MDPSINGLAYNEGEWSEEYKEYFVREYGWSSYSEDVATVFEWLIDVNNGELRNCMLSKQINRF